MAGERLMKDRRLEEKPACAVKAAPHPLELTCPHCLLEIEIWSDETEIECSLCGALVQKNTEITH
jgi:ribosomal protein S27E